MKAVLLRWNDIRREAAVASTGGRTAWLRAVSGLKRRLLTAVSAAVLLTAVASAGGAHLVTQTFNLHPGWNSIFLEVEPADNTPDSVFASLPLVSAWTWMPKRSATEYFQDLSEELLSKPGWLAFFPAGRHERMFNNLFRIYANQAYFIKLGGASDVEWTVQGRPAVPRYEIQADKYNLAGFPLATNTTLPTVQQFFLPSVVLTGTFYRLSSAGSWQAITNPATDRMQSGEAMWLFASGQSDYMGPVHVSVDIGDGLAYGQHIDERRILIKNLSSSTVIVRVADLSGPGGPLAYATTTAGILEWQALPASLALTLAAGETYPLRLAVRREQFTSSSFETTIQVTSDAGTRVMIPLQAERVTAQ